MRDAARVSQIGDDETGHAGKRFDGACYVLARGLVEIEHNWREVTIAKFIADGDQHGLTFLGEPAEDENDFRGDRVDDVANLFVVEKQIDKLGDLNVVDGDAWLISITYEEVLLL